MNSAKRYLVIVLLLCALTVTGAWAVSINMKNEKLERSLETIHRGDFEEFYDDMSLMARDFENAALSSDESYVINMLTSASEHASSAKEALSRLPVSQVYAGNIQSLLSKGEEFSKAKLREYLASGELTQSDRNSIRAISTAGKAFLEGLDGFYGETDSEEYSFIENSASDAFEYAEDRLSLALKDMGEENYDMPEVNYDGKYSSHIDPTDYKGISGEEVSKEDIMSDLKKNIGEGWEVSYHGEGKGNLPSHSFTATDGNNSMHVTYSRQGGHLIGATSENYPDQSKISSDEAISCADKFIEKLGIDGMNEEYYEKYNNILSVTYAYSHEGIKCLSDTMTVQVSLKDGKITGYEADKYYKNHTSRQSVSPEISVEEAAVNIHDDMNIISSSLCYLPTDGGSEKLCYEFLAERNDEKYLIYINAGSGRQIAFERVNHGEDTFTVEK